MTLNTPSHFGRNVFSYLKYLPVTERFPHTNILFHVHSTKFVVLSLKKIILFSTFGPMVFEMAIGLMTSMGMCSLFVSSNFHISDNFEWIYA